MAIDERELKALLTAGTPKPPKNFDEVLRRSGFAAGQPASARGAERSRTAHAWRVAALVGGCAAVVVAAATVWHHFRPATPPPVADLPAPVTGADPTTAAAAPTATSATATTTAPAITATTAQEIGLDELDAYSQTAGTVEELREKFDVRMRGTDNPLLYGLSLSYKGDGTLKGAVYSYLDRTDAGVHGHVAIWRWRFDPDELGIQTETLRLGGRTFFVNRNNPQDIYYDSGEYTFNARFYGVTQAEVLEELDKLIF